MQYSYMYCLSTVFVTVQVCARLSPCLGSLRHDSVNVCVL